METVARIMRDMPVPSVRRHHLGFWSVAFAFLVVMAFSTAPSPLYGLYQERDGFSALLITVIYATYAIGVVTSLVLAGHLSDGLGRRRVLVPAIAVSVVSAVMFLLWRDVPGLIAARIVNGLSVGVVAATATAYLSELHALGRPHDTPDRAQVIATAVNLGGLGLGAMVSGALAQWVGSPLTVPYVVFLVLLAVAVGVVALAPETRRRPNPLPAYHPQRVAVPAESRGTFAASAAAAVVGFGALGLFTGLASTFLVGTLGHPSHALTGLAILLMFWTGVVAQSATAAWPLRHVLALGIALMVLGLTLTVIAAWLATPSLGLFLAGGAVTGAGAGTVFKGAIGTVIAIAPPATRAEALAGLFLAGYVGLSFPVVGAGIALQYLSARATLLIFGLVVGAAILAAAPRLLRVDAAPDRVAATTTTY